MTIGKASPSPTNLLQGRHVLLTGAAGGIGIGIAAALERHGARVTRTDKRAGPGISPLDVTSEDAVAEGFDAAGEVTDVIHSAGDLIVGPVADTTLQQFRAAADSNLLGAFLVGREAARKLPTGGSLTFIASQAGFRAGANWGVYCAVKAGVMRLAEALAHELGPRTIRVNSICPGSIETPMLDDVYSRLAALSGEAPDALRQRYTTITPLRRNGTAGEIGDVCVFLVSPLASYVSGTSIPVDGGEVSA